MLAGVAFCDTEDLYDAELSLQFVSNIQLCFGDETGAHCILKLIYVWRRGLTILTIRLIVGVAMVWNSGVALATCIAITGF